MKPLTDRHKSLTQFLEYLISGGIYFWIAYGSFALFYGFHSSRFDFAGLGWSLWWAVIVSSLIGWIANFLMQRYWVFNDPNLRRHRTSITSRFIFITTINFLLGYLILYELKRAGLTPYIGQFVSAAFFTGWNWFWYRYWVFPSTASPKLQVTPIRLLAHIPHGRHSV